MIDPIAHWATNCSTESLNHILLNAEVAADRGKPFSTAAVDAARAEKDRRLADPNGNDFRPQFH